VHHEGRELDDVVMFDGTGLDGWTMAGPGGFALVDGALETRGGMGLLWYSARAFDDFVLRLEWRVESASDNGGVFVRFPDPHGDPWAAVHQGYEVQILDAAAESVRRTGALYTFAGPDAVLSHAPGEWNRLDVVVEGQRYRVEVNGRPACTWTGDRGLRGHIGLQNHDDASRVRYRDVVVGELPRERSGRR
jgi:hypothetical protein